MLGSMLGPLSFRNPPYHTSRNKGPIFECECLAYQGPAQLAAPSAKTCNDEAKGQISRRGLHFCSTPICVGA